MTRFWNLRMPDEQHFGEVIDSECERISCCVDPGHRRAGRRLGEFTALVDPRAIRDFTWIGAYEVLISPKVLRLFDKHRVTGFDAKPVKVTYPEDIEVAPPELFSLVVTGWGGFVSAAAGTRLKEWCHGCGYNKYVIADPSQLIDAAAWDGSDIFVVWPLPVYRFASDRLAEILRTEGVSGLELVPATSIPGKQSGWVVGADALTLMPEARARELEQRFKISQWLVEAPREGPS